MIDLNMISREIFVGTAPASVVDIGRLKDMGLTAVLSLQSDDDIKSLEIDWPALEDAYLRHQILLNRVPVIDYNDVSLEENIEQAASVLASLINIHHRVYVHCTAGLERSPSTVIGYFVWHRRWDIEKAVAHVTGRRQCFPRIEIIRRLTAQRRDSVA